MLQNYLLITLRSIVKNKIFILINVLGMGRTRRCALFATSDVVDNGLGPSAAAGGTTRSKAIVHSATARIACSNLVILLSFDGSSFKHITWLAHRRQAICKERPTCLARFSSQRWRIALPPPRPVGR